MGVEVVSNSFRESAREREALQFIILLKIIYTDAFQFTCLIVLSFLTKSNSCEKMGFLKMS